MRSCREEAPPQKERFREREGEEERERERKTKRMKEIERALEPRVQGLGFTTRGSALVTIALFGCSGLSGWIL